MTVHELMKILQGVDNNAVVRIISKDCSPIDDYMGCVTPMLCGRAVPIARLDFTWWRVDVCEIPLRFSIPVKICVS